MMQELVRVVRGDLPYRSIARNRIDAEDLCAVMIHHHHQSGRRVLGSSRRRSAPLWRPAGLLQEVPQTDHLRTGEILGVRLMHDVSLYPQVEGKFATVSAVHHP